MHTETRTTDCCIVGGGPCGMMLGYLLARRGIDVTVLEKHNDFFRDFRGDTIHPSTMEIMHELGILDEFLNLPHDKVTKFEGDFDGQRFVLGDFSRLKIREPYIAFMPQWDFLNFIAEKGKALSAFHLKMGMSFEGLKKEGGKVVGVIAKKGNHNIEIDARLTIAADGRHSQVREQTQLKIVETGVPIDILWFKVSRTGDDPKSIIARIEKGKATIMLNRTTYWQCGYIIPKGHFEDIKKDGLPAFKETLRSVAPFLGERVYEIKSWEEVKLLTIAVNHLRRWHVDGLLCLGDAAHAMSPVGGVGINLAIQDAVAAANILGPKFKGGEITEADLQKVQQRRTFPTSVVQKLQVTMQNNIIKQFIGSKKELKPPFFMRMINRFPFLQKIPAQIIGIGIRPEHVKF